MPGVGFFTRVDLTRGAARPKKPPRGVIPAERLHVLECRACPLNHARNLHPKMSPSGRAHPLLYVLGEAPGREEDRRGAPLVGDSWRRLREVLGASWVKRARFGNVIRDRPPGNRKPAFVEIECCRPSVASDIERARPRALLALANIGGTALSWFGAEGGIKLWRGRRFPARLGDSSFWVYPSFHPAYIARVENRRRSSGPDEAKLFRRDIKRMLREINSLPEPVVWTEEDFSRGLEVYPGRPGELQKVLSRLHEFSQSGQPFSFDWETSRMRPFETGWRPLSLALASSKRTISLAIDHPDAQWSGADRKRLMEALCVLFSADRKRRAIAHNASFDVEVNVALWGEGIARGMTYDCTMAQAFILDERPGGLSLDFLSLQYFGVKLKTLEKVNRKRLEYEPLDKLLRYGGIDARGTFELDKAQTARLVRE